MSLLRLLCLALAPAAASAAMPLHAAQNGGPINAYGAYNAPSEFDVKVARAFDTGPVASIDQLVKNLSLAIFQLSRHKIPKDPPQVFRVPHAELENYVCGTNCAIKAWYKPGAGIFLDESLQPETNVFHRSILLHELVHYFQDVGGYYGTSDACSRWFHRELDAYEVQNKYLGSIGHPSRVAYAGHNCSTLKAQAKENDGILRTQVFSGGLRHPDMED